MNQEATTQEYRGVLCRYCRQPIPVPAIVIGIENAAKHDETVSGLEQGGRVFTLRCRSCEGEHPYRSKEIVSFEGTPKSRISRSREAQLVKQSGRLSRAANA
jgi:hypothetical protein